MALDDIRNERIKKLETLEKSGIDAYPATVIARSSIAEIVKKFSTLARGKKKIAIAGRITAKREHGGSAFCDIKDASGKIQLFFKEDILGNEEYGKFFETADVGDFVEAEGKAKAIRTEAQALSSNPKVVELRWIEKWDGKVPTYWGNANPFVGLNNN